MVCITLMQLIFVRWTYFSDTEDIVLMAINMFSTITNMFSTGLVVAVRNTSKTYSTSNNFFPKKNTNLLKKGLFMLS